jgi:predicted site-specific integrase-resolvase
MKLSVWAKKQGISYITAWRWVKTGKFPLPFTYMPSGTIIVQETSKPEISSDVWIYCRVSSYDKKEDLTRQVERCVNFCATKGWVVRKTVKEIASGMNDSRPQLTKLLNENPKRLVVEHKDRLTRFGFGYFELLLPKLDCDLIVINRDKEEKEDLLKDLVAVITSFCCRLYGLRRAQNKIKVIKKELCDA